MKNKRAKTSRRAKMNKTYNELNPDGERSNLEDDLQYSSDDHFGDFDDDEDEEDEDWQEVENEPGFTVTMPVVDAQTPRGMIFINFSDFSYNIVENAAKERPQKVRKSSQYCER